MDESTFVTGTEKTEVQTHNNDGNSNEVITSNEMVNSGEEMNSAIDESNDIPSNVEISLNDILDSIIAGNSLKGFSPLELKQSLPGLKRKKVDLISSKSYIEANRITEIIKEITKLVHVAEFHEQCSLQMSELLKKRAEAQRALDTTIDEWKQHFQELDIQIQGKIQSLYIEHEKELADFDEKCQKELNNLPLRQTPKTIALRAKEDGLAKNELFFEADKIRKKAEKYEKAQYDTDKQKLAEEFAANRLKLIEKQLNQVKIVEQWSNERNIDLSRAKSTDIDAATKRVQRYDLLIKEAQDKGFAPNPNKGFSSKNVNRNESLQAVRNATLCIPEISSHHPRARPHLVKYRPSASVKRTANSRCPTSPNTL